MTEKLLIINADDYGRSGGVSEGIRHAHLAGIVSSSTVMVNMKAAIDDLQLALRETPDLALGVHLNLTVGTPCAPLQEVPSLVGPDGLFLGKTHLHRFSDRLNPREIEIEWRRQIECFLETGAALDHLDSHHHIALLSPDTWETYLGLARTYQCGVRTALPSDVDRPILAQSFPPEAVEFIAHEAMDMLACSGVHHPDAFFVSFFGTSATRNHLLSLLAELPQGTSELMCHPGFVDPTLLSSSGYTTERKSELEILTDPAVMQAVQDAGISLSTYRKAWAHK